MRNYRRPVFRTGVIGRSLFLQKFYRSRTFRQDEQQSTSNSSDRAVPDSVPAPGAVAGDNPIQSPPCRISAGVQRTAWHPPHTTCTCRVRRARTKRSTWPQTDLSRGYGQGSPVRSLCRSHRLVVGMRPATHTDPCLPRRLRLH